MLEISARNALAIDAAVKVLKETNFQKDPVQQWVRGIVPGRESMHTVRIDILFWLFQSPGMHQIVSVVIGKQENEWAVFWAWTKFDDGTTYIWEFTETGIPVLTLKSK